MSNDPFAKSFIDGLPILLDHSAFLALDVDSEQKTVALTFRVLTLDESDLSTTLLVVTLRLSGVGRVNASLPQRNEAHPRPAMVGLAELSEFVASLGGPVIDDDFLVDDPDRSYQDDQPSLEADLGTVSPPHVFEMFVELEPQLALRIFFTHIHAVDSEGCPIDLQHLVESGKRWWQAFHDGDPRTRGFGVFTLKDWNTYGARALQESMAKALVDPTSRLLPGERVLQVQRASRKINTYLYHGGQLHVSNYRLMFVVKRRGKLYETWSIPLNEITAVRSSWWWPLWWIFPTLRISTSSWDLFFVLFRWRGLGRLIERTRDALTEQEIEMIREMSLKPEP